MSIFAWVGILSSLVVYSMANNDIDYSLLMKPSMIKRWSLGSECKVLNYG